MHTLVIANEVEYINIVKRITTETSKNYQKSCYISIKDPHHIIIRMLNDIDEVDMNKFIVVDASKDVEEIQAIDKRTFVVNIPTLFNVYLFLRDLIQKENINAILLDSVSALIDKHPKLPLKDMLTNLLLEVGTFKCDSVVFANNSHKEHEVIKHIEPFIAKTMVLW
jgi:hypothetical protein